MLRLDHLLAETARQFSRRLQRLLGLFGELVQPHVLNLPAAAASQTDSRILATCPNFPSWTRCGSGSVLVWRESSSRRRRSTRRRPTCCATRSTTSLSSCRRGGSPRSRAGGSIWSLPPNWAGAARHAGL